MYASAIAILMPLVALCSASPPTQPYPAARARLEKLQPQFNKQPSLVNDAYVRLGIAIVRRFTAPDGDMAKLDAPWAELQARELEQVLDWTEQRIYELSHGASIIEVARPTGGPLTIRDGVLFAPTTTRKSSVITQRPYMFAGYGFFETAGASLPDFWDFGATLIQQERGPGCVNEDGTPTDEFQSILPILRTAADNHAKVDLMLPAHALPRWSRAAPGLMLPKVTGFIEFNIDHPVARKFVEQHLRNAARLTKDSQGLFSYCLTNEPEYLSSGRDEYSRPLWVEYLRKRHRTIDTLNLLYGTTYKRFEDVPVPEPRMPERVESKRAYFDWITFNHQHQADWHRWMTEILKSIAPNVWTHTKLMRVLDVSYSTSMASVPDPELFCEFTDLAGNDSWATLPAHEGPDSTWWRSQEIWYDLIHSFQGQPVYDSENHTIPVPHGPVPVPVDQTRCAIWQGALHHRWATVLWVWQKWEPQTHGVESDLTGTIYFRPANLYVAGKTMIDQNRFAQELEEINRDKAKIALLYSQSAAFWDDSYGPTLRAAYTALEFVGQPVTFISERQLATGRRSSANSDIQAIIVPAAIRVGDATVDALEKFTEQNGRVIRIGTDALARDEYDRPRQLPELLRSQPHLTLGSGDRELGELLKSALPERRIPFTRLARAEGQGDAHGVEFRVVRIKRGALVPIVNFNSQPLLVRLDLDGRAQDLLSSEPIDLTRIQLQPMQPRLIRILQ